MWWQSCQVILMYSSCSDSMVCTNNVTYGGGCMGRSHQLHQCLQVFHFSFLCSVLDSSNADALGKISIADCNGFSPHRTWKMVSTWHCVNCWYCISSGGKCFVC